MSNPDPMAEIRASFFVECEELLEALQDGLQSMDDGDADDETINVVFRAVHSIKGGAGAFGLDDLVRFAHRFETVLDGVRSKSLELSAPLTKLFFRAADMLSDLVRFSREDAAMPEDQIETLLAELDTHIQDEGDDQGKEIAFEPLTIAIDLDADETDDAIPDNPHRFEIEFVPEPELFATGNEPALLLRALSELGTMNVDCDVSRLPTLDALEPGTPYLSWKILLSTTADEGEIRSIFDFVEGLCTLTVGRENDNVTAPASDDAIEVDATRPPKDTAPVTEDASPSEPSKKDTRNAPAAVAPKSVVRVDLDRIERLVNLVGELVINQAMLSQSLEAAGLSPHSDAMNGLEEFQRLTRDIQDSVMMIRAQPVKSLFQRMSRIVREASAAVGKDVRLVTDGEATEVDKTVIERLADPLTHMIRNAVDHGLETSEVRERAGKPEQGVIRLSAAHRSGRVIIEISDDGGGINRPRVQQIAVDRGLIAPNAALGDTEIDNLLFLPGFSTASSVSDLSGRGVGMDVVRTAIQGLGGRITISSEPGTGTTFTISLPLTLAVLDGMVVLVAGETLVLPLNVVVETLTLTRDNLDRVRPGCDVVRVRGDFVPVYDLGCELGYRARQDDYLESVVLLIAHEDGTRAALIVDEIQDQRQVVIKGLDDSFYRAPGIAAATILGDGQIALILDPSDVISQASRSSVAGAGKKQLEMM